MKGNKYQRKIDSLLKQTDRLRNKNNDLDKKLSDALQEIEKYKKQFDELESLKAEYETSILQANELRKKYTKAIYEINKAKANYKKEEKKLLCRLKSQTDK